MVDIILKKRVHHLEKLMAKLIETVDRTDQQLAETDRQLARTSQQQELTGQQLAETDRQLARTSQQQELTGQQLAETDRRLDKLTANLDRYERKSQENFDRNKQKNQEDFDRYKRENQEAFDQYKQENLEAFERSQRESKANIKAMNKKWGELSNKMGTMAEDLVAPSIGRILRETVGSPDNDDAIEYLAVRVRKRHPDRKRSQEYDVVAVCGEYMLINETKSRLTPEDVPSFVEMLSEAREFFPEYADRKIIGALGSLYVDKSLVRFGERAGLIVLGFGEDVMDVLNSPEFFPKSF